jgi:small subunit ribosomal protein S18
MAKKEDKSKKRRKIVKIKVPENCVFCKKNEEPDYKKFRTLEKYLSERAKILGSDRSGVCSKHQRRLSTAIKRARFLALLPFTPFS